MKATQSDQIREFARIQYVEPARHRGEKCVSIIAGDVHRGLKLHNRVPLVCNALSSREFVDGNCLELESKVGPPSGLSTTVTFTYRLRDIAQNSQQGIVARFAPFVGVARDTFAALGGGEAFLRSERDAFDKSVRPAGDK